MKQEIGLSGYKGCLWAIPSEKSGHKTTHHLLPACQQPAKRVATSGILLKGIHMYVTSHNSAIARSLPSPMLLYKAFFLPPSSSVVAMETSQDKQIDRETHTYTHNSQMFGMQGQ